MTNPTGSNHRILNRRQRLRQDLEVGRIVQSITTRLHDKEGDDSGRRHLYENLFEITPAVLSPSLCGDLFVRADVERHNDLARVLPAQVPDHVLVFDRRRSHHDAPGTAVDQALCLTLGANPAGDHDRDVHFFDKPVYQRSIPIVPICSCIEVDDKQIVDSLVGPVLGPAYRVIVQRDGFVETTTGQSDGKPAENIDSGIQVHDQNLARHHKPGADNQSDSVIPRASSAAARS